MPTFKSYLIGFITSIILLLAAFTLVQIHLSSGHLKISHELIIPVIFILAIIQAAIQLIFFLHLHIKKSRQNLLFFVSAMGIIVLIVVGSLWIMEKLNFNMSPEQVQEYMKDQGAF